MIIRYFLGAEAFVFVGYILLYSLLPKKYSYIFYKFLGIIIYSLILWYSAQISGNTWTTFAIWPVFAMLVIGGTIAAYRSKLPSVDIDKIKEFIAIELISFFLFYVLVYIRTFKPDILGTEKLMDVALINTLIKQGKVPIENPWMSGFYMNYYYFGHFLLANIQYLFRIPTAVGYNLAISLLGVWIFQSVYVLARKIKLNIGHSYLATILITFGGNLFLLFESILKPENNQWFASATRVIQYTINEFPSYSIILGDLHGHYLSYPFFIIGIFLIIDIFFPDKDNYNDNLLLISKSSLLGILLGALYLTNSWDVLTLAIFGGMLGLALLVFYMKKSPKKRDKWLLDTILYVGLPIILFALPQYLSSKYYYTPAVDGIGLNSMFSPLWDEFRLFGQFIVPFLIGIALIIIGYFKYKKVKSFLDSELLLPIFLFYIGVLLILIVEFVYAKDIFSELNPAYHRTNTVFKIYYHAWVFLGMGAIGTYIKGKNLLLNNVKGFDFKFKKLSASYFAQIRSQIKSEIVIATITDLFVLFIVAVMLSYPYLAIKQFITPRFTNTDTARFYNPNYSNGYSYVAVQKGSEYNLLMHLGALPYSHIAEAVTYDSYSYYARASAYTGHSAITGWPLHNVQWYGGYDGVGIDYNDHKLKNIFIADRVLDLETLYFTQDVSEASRIINKYGIEYIVIGAAEKLYANDKGKELNTELLLEICELDWKEDDNYILKCELEND